MAQALKLTTLSFPIPYKQPGNNIQQRDVAFDVYREAEIFKAVPLLNESELRIANLPHELLFTYQQGKPVSSRGNKDGNFHVIEEIVSGMKKEKLLA